MGDKTIEIRPIRPEEKKAAELCINRSFSKNPDHIEPQGFFNQFNYMPMEREDLFWALFLKGKPVCALMLVPFQLTIGEMSLSLLGLTGVGTDPDHRRKGYASMLLNRLHTYMEKQGFDGAVLHSALDQLYYKNGYEFSFCTWGAIIEMNYLRIDELLDDYQDGEALYLKIYQKGLGMEAEDVRKIIMQLYPIWQHSPNRLRRKVSLLRSEYYFLHKILEKFDNGNYIVTLSQHEKILGYALIQPKEGDTQYEIFEIYSLVESPLHYLKLIRSISEINSAPNLSIFIDFYSEDTKLMELIQRLSPKYYHNIFPKNMANLFNPVEIIKKYIPTLNLRLGQILENLKGPFDTKINVILDGKEVLLRASKNLLTITELGDPSENTLKSRSALHISKHEFIAMIFGYVPIEDLDLEGYNNLSIFNQNLLKSLFPPLDPIWDYLATY